MRVALLISDCSRWEVGAVEELGEWQFEDHSPLAADAEVRCLGASGELKQLFEDGTVQTLRDFLLHVVGDLGTRSFTWKGQAGPPDLA